MKRESIYAFAATAAINRALAAVARLIAGGAAAGWWPEDCPLKRQCPHAGGCSARPRITIDGSRAVTTVDQIDRALGEAQTQGD